MVDISNLSLTFALLLSVHVQVTKPAYSSFPSAHPNLPFCAENVNTTENRGDPTLPRLIDSPLPGGRKSRRVDHPFKHTLDP